MTIEEQFKEKLLKTNQSFVDLQKKLFINSNDKLDEVLDIAKNGFPYGFGTSISEINELIRFHDGSLMAVTGYSSHGKSHLIEQLLCNLMCLHNKKIGYYAAESQIKITFIRAIEIILASQIKDIQESLIIEVSKFLNNKMYVINTDNGLLPLDKLLDHIKVAFSQENVDYFLIDNASTIEDLATDDKQQIRKFLNELNLIKKTYNKTIIVVAHPTKPYGKAEKVDGYKISGAAEWFNLVDVGITIFRDFDTNISEFYVWKCKNYWEGKVGTVSLNFDYFTRRFVGSNNDKSPMLKFKPAKYDIPKVPIKQSDYNNEFDTPF